MTLRTPPSWQQQSSHPAENDRLTTQASWSASGIARTNDLKVTQSGTPGMSVVVAAGWGIILGDYQINMGTYVAYNDADYTVAITGSNPTNPRIDRIVMTINDAYYSGSTNDVTIGVVTGTAAASPVAPATPTNSISLATIAVAAGATTIVNANITDTRIRADRDEMVLSTSTTTGVPLIIQNIASQSANTLEIKNSSGTVVGWIDSSGNPQGTLVSSAGGFNPFFLIGA
jgi:hypothetical protein